MNKSLLISEKAIAEKVVEIATALNETFIGKELILVAVLKGSICFVADLIRHLDVPFQLEFVRAASYGMHGMQPKDLELSGLNQIDVKGKVVLLIDDIYDTGKTLSTIYHKLRSQNPQALHTLVLLKKKLAHQGDITPTYVCFDIENEFVVGYGLDYKELFRGLKGIYKISP